MVYNLDRTDIKNLFKGTPPPYEMMNRLTELKLGTYTGGFRDDWTWSLNNIDLSDNELLCLYLEMKTYWANKGIC